jgi:hypothetical protein
MLWECDGAPSSLACISNVCCQLISSAVAEAPAILSDSPGKADVTTTPAASMPHEFATARPAAERRNIAGSLFSAQPPLTAVPVASTPTSEDALTFEQLKELRDKYNTVSALRVECRCSLYSQPLSLSLLPCSS